MELKDFLGMRKKHVIQIFKEFGLHFLHRSMEGELKSMQ